MGNVAPRSFSWRVEAAGRSLPPMLKLLTLNLWFSDKLRHARTRAVLKLIEDERPTVCCFQEVVPEVAQLLVRSLPGWSASDPGDGSTVAPYGVMTLVAPGTPANFSFHKLPTRMWRWLLVAELEGLAVGTVHLESLANHPVREAQLEVCASVLRRHHDSVLVGDFNFDSERNFHPPHDPLENEALAQRAPGFVDLWPVLHPGERGLTFDSAINPYLDQSEQMRYDRVIARLQSWRATGIARVGHESVDPDGLTPQEQAELERPPTPPRPSRDLKPRDSPWEQFPKEEEVASPASKQSGLEETPPPRRGRLFLSDHFGLLATLVPATCAADDS